MRRWDGLIELDLSAQYFDALAIEILGLVAFVKATAGRFRDFAPDRTVLSTTGASRLPLINVENGD
jgi:hypothetical protein